jgi:hypothetical protein
MLMAFPVSGLQYIHSCSSMFFAQCSSSKILPLDILNVMNIGFLSAMNKQEKVYLHSPLCLHGVCMGECFFTFYESQLLTLAQLQYFPMY